MKKKLLTSLLALAMVFTCFACPITASSKKTVKIKSISLSKASLSLTVDDTYTLNVSFNPKNASNKKIKWSSSNEDIADVDSGVVTANDDGTCIITAKSNNGKTATCKVTVTDEDSNSSGTSSDSSTPDSKYGIVYGDVSSIATPTTADEFQAYLNTKYPSVNTPMGAVYCNFSFAQAILDSNNDYGVTTEFTDKSTLDVADLANNKRGYTNEEIKETKAELQELQKEIYADSKAYFPHKKISGVCVQKSSDYSLGMDGKISFLWWQNYDDTGYITDLTWQPDFGDVNLTNS